MTFRTSSIVLLATAVLIIGGCNKKGGCIRTEIGPSCLPGPGGGVRASVQSWGVYEGDCPNDPTTCQRELTPTEDPALQYEGRDKTYILRNHTQKHTVYLCVAHPEVPGRHMSIRVRGHLNSGGTQGPPFDEADSSKKSPVCMGVSFDMAVGSGVTNTSSGEVGFNEDNQDLFTPTKWLVTLGFRVIPKS